jgi:hypothetical protein
VPGGIGVLIDVLSEPPEKKHPWRKHYTARGLSRPPTASARASDTTAEVESTDTACTSRKQAELSAELAAAVVAATAELPVASSTAPFITVLQKEAGQRELRRRLLIRAAWIGAAGLAGLFALHFAVTRLVFRTPAGKPLQSYGEALALAVVPLYSSDRQSLQPSGATLHLVERIDSSRLRYSAEVALKLRQPLYAPAATNGTVLYRQLQQSLQVARDRDLKYSLLAGSGPEAPELPLLIHVTHRAGEPLIVRVPFEVRRFGWTWRIEPPQLARRVANRIFDGAGIERYADVPHIVFGPREAMAEIRQRMRLARAYIVAVTKEVQKSADAVAVDEFSDIDPSMGDVPALDLTSFDLGPDALAIDPDALAIDPDAPAFDPDAVAVEPEEPAVPSDLSAR